MKYVEFGQVVTNYASTRNDMPNSLFESLMLRNITFDRKKVADLGSSTGAFTKKLKLRKANVVGVEPSSILLAEAEASTKREYLPIPYINGTAEQTGLDSDEYDIVTVMRAWHRFNREEALTEIKRVLKNKGTMLIIDSGFLSDHAVVEETLRVLGKYVPNGVNITGTNVEAKQRLNGFPVEWFEEWRMNGFELRDFYKIDYCISFTNKEWIERAASISWVADLEKEVRQTALEELSETLKMRLGPEASFMIPHSSNVVILKLIEK